MKKKVQKHSQKYYWLLLFLSFLGNIVKISKGVQSPFQKWDFGNSSQNHAKVDIKHFFPCPILQKFSTFFQIHFVRDCLSKEAFGHNSVQSSSKFFFFFGIFYTFKAFSQSLMKIEKQVSCIKVLNLVVCVSTILHIWFRKASNFVYW